MKFLTTLAMSMLTSCSLSGAEEVRLMDAIEAQLVLPADAAPIARYARFYYAEDGRRIVGIYLLGDRAGLSAGSRKWVSSHWSVPAILDGGCTMVTIIYDRWSGRVASVECNGVA